MNALDRLIVAVAPQAGLARMRAKRAAEALMRYDIADGSRRTRSVRANGLDADGAGARRGRISHIARDMVRNSALAARAQAVVVANTVGDGIIPGIEAGRAGTRQRFLELVRDHLDTTAIDADGRCNLYGLQRLALAAVVADGEVLIRVRRRRTADRLPMPFQLQLLEADHLDASHDIATPGGARIVNGIEYDAIGRRVAYHLYDEHPGSTRGFAEWRSRRVPASEVIHLYRQDRPGQQRGVSWFAPVAMHLQDLSDYLDAQLMRQKIAACFAAFRVTPDGESGDDAGPVPAKLSPGAIATLAPGEDIRFGEPPRVDGLDEFTRSSLRAIAAGMGLTYEALSGDLSGVNFSSARMGRLEMDRNVSAWQWLMLVPQMLDPIGALLLEYWSAMEPTRDLRRVRVTWTPPARVIVDPAREIPAMRETVRAGFRSWQGTVRALGYDPETVAAEIAEDNARFDALGLSLDSDGRMSPRGGGVRQPAVQGESAETADD